jgi:hypothetical protein
MGEDEARRELRTSVPVPRRRSRGRRRRPRQGAGTGIQAAAAVESPWPFGPMFFLGQLGAFVRDRCASPGEGLPVVEIHLAEGEVLDLCHVIGVAPAWVALAVNDLDAHEGEPRMTTELVPYARIARVTVRPCRSSAPEIGFVPHHIPELLRDDDRVPMSPESALRAAASPAAPFPDLGRRPRAPGGGPDAGPTGSE